MTPSPDAGGGTPVGRASQTFPGVSASATGTQRESLARRHRSGAPLTAVQVENEILRLCGIMEDLTDELDGRARRAAESESNHKAMWASKFLQAEGTEARRKAEADVDTHTLYMTRKIEEGLYQSCKEALNSIRAQLDAMRSVSANIRAQT